VVVIHVASLVHTAGGFGPASDYVALAPTIAILNVGDHSLLGPIVDVGVDNGVDGLAVVLLHLRRWRGKVGRLKAIRLLIETIIVLALIGEKFASCVAIPYVIFRLPLPTIHL